MPLNENWKTWRDFPKSFEDFRYLKDQTKQQLYPLDEETDKVGHLFSNQD